MQRFINIHFFFCNSMLFRHIIRYYTIFLIILGPSHGKIVVCYVGTWSVYRPGRGSFSIDNIDPTLCTHLIYSFAGLNTTDDSMRALDPWQDLTDNYGKGGYNKMTSLRTLYPHLKISLAIGGWNEGSQNYSLMAGNPSRRSRFVANALAFIRYTILYNIHIILWCIRNRHCKSFIYFLGSTISTV